jgi:acyl-CoA reductase-like NAD-dependent aldehyde dehydrogenase
MSSTVTDVKEYQWFAGGQWRDVPSGKLFDDFEPYPGSLYARVPDCGVEEARLAISAAHEATDAWSDTPPAEKARLFLKDAQIVRRRRPEIADSLTPRRCGSWLLSERGWR